VDAEGPARQCRPEAPGRRRALARDSNEWRVGDLTEVALRRGVLTAQSTSVLSRASVVRATGLAGSLGCFPGPEDSPGPLGRKRRQWGVRSFSSRPLHRCVHADSGGSGQCGWCLDWCLPGTSVSGPCCSLPTEGNLPRYWRTRKRVPVRGSVVGSVCSGSVLVAEVGKKRRTQRSHLGCGRVGGRGSSSQVGNRTGAKGRLALHHPATGGGAKGPRRATCWWKTSRAAEAPSLHGLLVESVLVWRIRVLASGSGGRQGRQSFGALGLDVVNSRSRCERSVERSGSGDVKWPGSPAQRRVESKHGSGARL
jgi:hypothetical protein